VREILQNSKSWAVGENRMKNHRRSGISDCFLNAEWFG
jgi:hypothetical protein